LQKYDKTRALISTVKRLRRDEGNVQALRLNRGLAAMVAAGALGVLVLAGVSPAHATATNRTQAVRAAREYLQTQAFSLKGLVKQLEFDGYSVSDATYGARHSGANWTHEAAEAARSYLQTQAFSLKGLVKQLEFDGYTARQAAYGATRSRANWMQQAAKAAKSYLQTQAFSFSGMVRQLQFDGFTHAQAAHGARAAGL
jgi:outer membrane murein-binding lipoprotein Lpp